jgi:hypothetical protein
MEVSSVSVENHRGPGTAARLVDVVSVQIMDPMFRSDL